MNNEMKSHHFTTKQRRELGYETDSSDGSSKTVVSKSNTDSTTAEDDPIVDKANEKRQRFSGCQRKKLKKLLDEGKSYEAAIAPMKAQVKSVKVQANPSESRNNKRERSGILEPETTAPKKKKQNNMSYRKVVDSN